MWPILVCALVAVAVVGERSFWWLRESRRRDPKKAGADPGRPGKFRHSRRRSKSPKVRQDPVMRMIYRGLNHVHTSMQGALNWPPALNWSGPGDS